MVWPFLLLGSFRHEARADLQSWGLRSEMEQCANDRHDLIRPFTCVSGSVF